MSYGLATISDQTSCLLERLLKVMTEAFILVLLGPKLHELP